VRSFNLCKERKSLLQDRIQHRNEKGDSVHDWKCQGVLGKPVLAWEGVSLASEINGRNCKSLDHKLLETVALPNRVLFSDLFIVVCLRT
jgi:hypothetical protein